jgi:hypothetical protein
MVPAAARSAIPFSVRSRRAAVDLGVVLSCEGETPPERVAEITRRNTGYANALAAVDEGVTVLNAS